MSERAPLLSNERSFIERLGCSIGNPGEFCLVMAIRQEDIERVRQSVDLVTLIGERVALKRSGRQWMGICPFHSENSPSLSVSGEKGFFHCFGCQKHGDAITFLKELDHLDFVEAVEALASRAGIELQQDTNENAAAERKQRNQLSDAMGKAVEWYHDQLLKGPDGGAARAYLRERGYNGDIVRQFQIGWAPDDWDRLNRSLRLPRDVVSQTGLGFVNSRGRVTDSFRGRIMFPIFDPTGKPLAFGGRILPGSDQAKYKNSSETPLYSKSKTLYALNWAKADIVNSGEVIVCEGYTDVIGFFQAGMPRAVATCGTALTEGHIRILTNFAKRIVLAYDADGAGQNAAARVYEWEQKLGIDLVVVDLPRGADPADLARKDPEALREAVKNAKSFLAFRLDRVLNAADLRTVEGRARAAAGCVALVAEQPNQMVRDQYLMTIADRCRVPVEDLRTMLTTGNFEIAVKTPTIDIRTKGRPRNDPPETERAALKVAIQHPEQVSAYFNQVLPGGLNPGIEDVLFEDPRAAGAFRALIDAPTFLEAVDIAEPEAGELLGRLVMEEESGTAAEEFVRLVDRAAHRVIRELEVEVRVRPDGFSEIMPTLAWLKLTVEQLRTRDSVNEASAALIGWLMSELQPL